MDDNSVLLFRSFLSSLGLDEALDPELKETPARFTQLLRELFASIDKTPPTLSTFELDPTDEPPGPVLICAIPFKSMCVHHILPFFGAVDVAYLPAQQMVGFGSIGRVVDHFAQKPQVQERMIAEIADHLEHELKPKGLLVRLRARQLCMEMRGAAKTGELISFASRGVLKSGTQRSELISQFEKAQQVL